MHVRVDETGDNHRAASIDRDRTVVVVIGSDDDAVRHRDIAVGDLAGRHVQDTGRP